ncbi:MAG: hypothetical protein U0792_20770 [Gemmataceae bacterium]
MIVYSCPHCNEELEVSDRMAGRTTRCPSCGEDVTVPEAQAERRDRSRPWERGKSRELREPREPEETREDRSGRSRSGDELSAADLRQVATYQRGVLLCILLYGGLVLAQFGLPPDLRMVLLIPAVPVAIAAAVFVFLMSMKVYNSAGIALAILTFVPCLGLLILLVVNQKATSVLQEHGYQVGLLGASLSQFDKRRRRRDDRDD